MKSLARVTVLGQEYLIRSDAPAEEAERAAALVNERLEVAMKAGRGADTLGVVVLALLNIAGDYLRLRDGSGVGALETRLEHLLARIDAEVPGPGST